MSKNTSKSHSGGNRVRPGNIGDSIKGEVKPVKYERPGARPAPSPKPPKKKKD